ncbi:MAG: RNA chaperone Hfq [Acidobacteriota bacterium]|nr:RNA chaperone Hfq [Blastocatellia bacterium]MDW8412223.1 RNA chaperone Hfq [Acidobacteriota bacterium]
MNDVNVQDVFLEHAKVAQCSVTLYLGKLKLVGKIKDYDRYSVTVDFQGRQQLISKQAISVIQLPRGQHTKFTFVNENGKTVVKRLEVKKSSKKKRQIAKKGMQKAATKQLKPASAPKKMSHKRRHSHQSSHHSKSGSSQE